MRGRLFTACPQLKRVAARTSCAKVKRSLSLPPTNSLIRQMFSIRSIRSYRTISIQASCCGKRFWRATRKHGLKCGSTASMMFCLRKRRIFECANGSKIRRNMGKSSAVNAKGGRLKVKAYAWRLLAPIGGYSVERAAFRTKAR